MYALVLSILAAAFLLFMGTLFSAGSVVILIGLLERRGNAEDAALIVLVMLVPVAILFLIAGVMQLAGTIRHLRGTTARATALERAFHLLNADFSGRTFEDRYR